jgi:hypothetical protein
MDNTDNPAKAVGEPFALRIKQVAAADCISESEVYNRLSRGEYSAVKDGRRTLILWESVKARRTTLKPATFKAYGKVAS